MKFTPAVLEGSIARFKKSKILVLGDLVLDLYIRGEVERISPEAPVPVVWEKTRRFILGGAGNVASNVRALGAAVTLVGIVGHDAEAKLLKSIAKEQGILPRFVVDSGRPTTLKTRATARRHQILRIDREATHQANSKIEREIIQLIKRLPAHDMVILSDYTKGCLTPSVVRAVKERFGHSRVIAGAKPASAALYRKVRAVTLNLREAADLTGIVSHTTSDAHRAVRALGKEMDASILLTRGEHGITAFDLPGKQIYDIPARALHIYDVTGAGDTVLGVAGLMLAGGSDMLHAAEAANHAAGVVVGKEGTETVSPKELLAHIRANAGDKKLS